jgi:hypothetical protein
VSRGGCGRRGPRVSVSAPGRANNLRRVYKAAVDAAGADLGHLDLRGPHDLRHTFASGLEDAAIPSRVIDVRMGHASGRRDRGAAPRAWRPPKATCAATCAPSFGRRQLRQITPSVVLRWQHDLEEKLSHSGVMACRSILLRILDAARRERLIPTNPVPDVEASQATHQPRADLRARAPAHPHSRGVRPLPGCLPPLLPRPLPHPGRHRAAQRRAARVAPRRVYPELRRIEVIEVRYEAGRFGRGFKAEPKSPASVRVVPMCEQVRQAIVRQVAAGAGPDELVFPGPDGSNSIPRGPAPRCRPTTCAASTGPRSPPPARTWRTSTYAAPRPAPHVRHLAGGRRHPGPGHR